MITNSRFSTDYFALEKCRVLQITEGFLIDQLLVWKRLMKKWFLDILEPLLVLNLEVVYRVHNEIEFFDPCCNEVGFKNLFVVVRTF